MANVMIDSSRVKPHRDKTASPKRILIIDDHPLYREGVSHFISMQPDLDVCGEAEDIQQGLAMAEKLHPDLVIVDLTLKNGNGIDFIRSAKAQFEELPILVLSMHDESLYAERALRAGAKGYLSKGQGTRSLMDAIRIVLSGHIYMSDTLKEKVLERQFTGTRERSSSMSSLSDRELEVFQFIGEGLTTAEIARNLRLSVKTVETYRAKIKLKLNLKNNMELIQRAVHAAHWSKELAK